MAIGDPSTLQTRFADGAAGRALRPLEQAYGIRSSVQSVGRQTLPAASVGALRYARVTDR